MKTEPVWELSHPQKYPALDSDFKFDVAVIGGGITGVTTAYLLKKAGKKVCLLERKRLGSGDTACTTAHLTYVTDLRISELSKTFGEKAAALVWNAGAAAIDTIESNIREEQIDCDFRRVPGFLLGSMKSNKRETKSLVRNAEQARKLGFPARFLDSIPYFNCPGIQFPNQAKFHPLKYISALAKIVDGDGAAVFEQTEVNDVLHDPPRVTANHRQLEVDYVVIATHVPIVGKSGMLSATLLQTKIHPYTSYVIGAKLPKDLVPEACFWDTSDPYYYLRIDSGDTCDYAIFGGEDHKTGQAENTEECYAKLDAALWQIFPNAKPDRRWSGRVVETTDALPFVGETAKHQFVATGFSGNGMTFGTLSALMARDAVLGRENPWQTLFAVDRKKIRGGAWNYLTENLDFPYYYVKDRITGADGDSTRSVKKGAGKILDLDGQRVACSRDDNGMLRSVSAYCTHMSCIVHWNGAEQTWDCPCHGSRFRPDGTVLGGPAETPLEPVKPTAKKPPKRPAKRARPTPLKPKHARA